MHIIVNPTAGRGRAIRAARELHEYLAMRSVLHIVWETKHPGDATNLSARAVADGTCEVWVIGGDATLREAAKGLLGTCVPMGLIPCGTGNDLCRTLGVPANDPVAAYELQQGSLREIDLWLANEHIFLNVCGIGFDVDTLIKAGHYRKLPGSMPPYLFGVLSAIAGHRDISLNMILDVDAIPWHGKTLMLTMANGRYIGGGMCAAPGALPDDGLLDIVRIAPVPRRHIPLLLPKFLKGEHLSLPITTSLRAREVRIDCEQDIQFQADGELFPMRSLYVRPCPHKLLIKGIG